MIHPAFVGPAHTTALGQYAAEVSRCSTLITQVYLGFLQLSLSHNSSQMCAGSSICFLHFYCNIVRCWPTGLEPDYLCFHNDKVLNIQLFLAAVLVHLVEGLHLPLLKYTPKRHQIYYTEELIVSTPHNYFIFYTHTCMCMFIPHTHRYAQ